MDKQTWVCTSPHQTCSQPGSILNPPSTATALCLLRTDMARNPHALLFYWSPCSCHRLTHPVLHSQPRVHITQSRLVLCSVLGLESQLEEAKAEGYKFQARAT